MVNWKNTDSVKYGVAIAKFDSNSPFGLSLTIGDAVLIYEETENNDWYRGCLLANRTLKGVFPVSYVHIKWYIDSESTTDVDIATSKELSVVLEITSVLKEWGAILKQLFVKKSEKTNKLRELMFDLMNRRRQIMSGALTTDQLKQVKQEIANKIDFGNDFLGLDMSVRDSEGNLIDVESTGVIDLYKMHLECAEKLEQLRHSIRSGAGGYTASTSSTFLQYNGHNLYVCIKNVVCKIDDDSEVFIALYDGQAQTFISEHYMVSWNKKGMPKDLDKLHNLSSIFTDLGKDDLDREKLYIVCQIIRIGRMDIKDADNKKWTQNIRRPFGVAVLHISDIVQGKITDDPEKEYFLQLQMLNNEDLDTMIKKTIQKSTSTASGQGIWLSIRMLHGDLQQVKEEHPLLINQYTAIARKQGFPDVIMPGDIRNDMYLSLLYGNFEKGHKTSNKNIQVIVGVYDLSGNLLDKVLSPGTGEVPLSEFNSTVYYHNPTPKWGEFIKLQIPIEKVNKTHIRFSFKHRATIDEKDKSQKIFSLAYVNLITKDGTCLQDSSHDLAVYKCESKKIEDCNTYMKLPSLKCDVQSSGKKAMSSGGLTYSKTESFKIGFQLCSTKLAQNVDLLALLKWRQQKDKLTTILKALHNVSGQEIVKFLQDTFDALFAILTEDSAKYGEMVTDAVVFCISLLADKKYHRFRAILDTYILNLFSSTRAYITLLEVLQMNIENTEVPDLSTERREHIQKYYKALEYLVKFIVRSRSLSERAAPGKGRLDFEASISNLFSSVMRTMKIVGNQVLLLQGCALKYIPAVFGDLLEVFDAAQLGHFAKDLVEHTPHGKLQTQKLTTIHQLVKSPLFFNPESRAVLRPMVISQLKTNLTNFEELKICADIINDMLSSFELGDTNEDIAFVVENLFRCIVQTVIKMNLNSQLVGNYVAFIIGILDLMKNEHYDLYINSYDTDFNLLDGLMELFIVFREFIKDSVYAKAWVSMTMIQNNVILRALLFFSEALYEKFLVGESFQFQLWDNFFQLAVAFITQESLQLESFSTSKRNKLLEKYGDMRKVIGKKIVEMWQFLGINKIRLIQNMVRPFLEMTLIPEPELREKTMPVFFDMIECEFRNRQHFKQVESEVIIHLDHMIETGMKGDEEYKELFAQILTQKFLQEKQHNPRLCEVGLIFVEMITKLLSRLLDYRSVILSEDNINNRMSCTVNILNFYQEIRREEMKERYLYKLCDLHLNVGSYTEAAFTLLQHAELLKWSDEPLINANTNISSNRYQAKTQRELKERLYKDIIDYFDKGKMWEYGISRCKELAQQYETETYDYIQLSEILEKEARFFENIIKTVVRPEPTYFRVGYFGRGFPTFLRNKLFIYRGDELETLGDFTMRLTVQFPGAQFLTTLEPPGADITDSIGQWLQVCKVDPKPVERRKFRGKNVAIQIKKFYDVNDVSEFALNRPFHRGTKNKDSEFTTLWIERTTMNTEYTFPGKLRWFEIKTTNVVELNPIENALDTIQTKNKELVTLNNQFEADHSLSLNPLSMLLNGVIDAAVMGGITNYEKIFFVEDYIKDHPDHAIYIQMLKESIVEQCDICEKGLVIHKQLVSEELKPFHQKMETVFKETQKKVAPYRKQIMKVAQRDNRDSRADSFIIPTRGLRAKSEMDMFSLSKAGVLKRSPVDRYTHAATTETDAPPLPERGGRNTVIIGSPTLQPIEDIFEDQPPLPLKGKQSNSATLPPKNYTPKAPVLLPRRLTQTPTNVPILAGSGNFPANDGESSPKLPARLPTINKGSPTLPPKPLSPLQVDPPLTPPPKPPKPSSSKENVSDTSIQSPVDDIKFNEDDEEELPPCPPKSIQQAILDVSTEYNELPSIPIPHPSTNASADADDNGDDDEDAPPLPPRGS